MMDRRHGEWIHLNVGGRVFTTTKTTLCAKEPESMLAKMFNMVGDDDDRYNLGDDDENYNNIFCKSNTTTKQQRTFKIAPSPQDRTGAYLIDRSPNYFEPILNYLRHGKCIIDHNVNIRGVLEEAKFYGIASLIPILEAEIDGKNNKTVETPSDQTMLPLTRQDVIRAIMSTSSTSELRFQGFNLAGANLSKLDLRAINLKYANLKNACLKGANLSNANLERADLSHSNLEGAQLSGATLNYTNLEGANLRAISIQEPVASRHNFTYFEGANLKNTNLEGSQMAYADLRKAALNNANLQNCDLRNAVLVGADLENCDLSGSDLHEANLSRANLKGVQFEMMQAPTHLEIP